LRTHEGLKGGYGGFLASVLRHGKRGETAGASGPVAKRRGKGGGGQWRGMTRGIAEEGGVQAAGRYVIPVEVVADREV
jgi:hypothetical protein